MKEFTIYSLPAFLILFVAWQVDAGQCEPLYAHTVNLAGATRGYAVAAAGDIDHDGFGDFLVGTPHHFYPGSGAAQVLSGKTGAVIRGFGGTSLEGKFGASVSSAGDFNMDGFDDIIVGGPEHGAFDAGTFRVISGFDFTDLLSFASPVDFYFLGRTVSSAGDVNKDGYSDIIAGAPGADLDVVQSFEGAVFVFSGANEQILYFLPGATSGERFGWSVSQAGDLNGDDYDDFIIGAPNKDSTGAVYVFSGLDADTLFYFTGADTGDHFGIDVSFAGDVNSDGVPDIIVGAPHNDENGTDAGKAYVFSGLDGDTLHQFRGAAPGDEFGNAVASAGDMNKDGFYDLIIGAYLNDGGGEDAGRAYVFSGKFGDTLLVFTGDTLGDHFGFSVAAAGDVDSNGFTDIIIGAPRTKFLTAADCGTAYLYSCCCIGIRGDIDGNGTNNTILDLNFLVNDIFRGGQSAPCDLEADLNSDGSPSAILDLNYLVNDIFRGGPSAGACY